MAKVTVRSLQEGERRPPAALPGERVWLAVCGDPYCPRTYTKWWGYQWETMLRLAVSHIEKDHSNVPRP